MPGEVTDLIRDWRDFYELVGTAAVVLIGLVLVAAAVAAGPLAAEARALVRTLLTPTVAHLTAALVLSMLVSVPTLTWHRLGAALIAAGVSGLLYAASVWWSLRRGAGPATAIDGALWYVLAPAVSFILLLIAGGLVLLRHGTGIELLGGTLLMLLLLGIRNAWDLTIQAMLRAPSK